MTSQNASPPLLVEGPSLGPTAMAQARKRALELEQHAYTVGKDPYRRTPPVEHAFQAGPSP